MSHLFIVPDGGGHLEAMLNITQRYFEYIQCTWPILSTRLVFLEYHIRYGLAEASTLPRFRLSISHLKMGDWTCIYMYVEYFILEYNTSCMSRHASDQRLSQICTINSVACLDCLIFCLKDLPDKASRYQRYICIKCMQVFRYMRGNR